MNRIRRLVLALVALATTVAIASSPTSAADPAVAAPSLESRALIDAHVAWLGGWAALEALRDFTCTGTVATAGRSGLLTVQQRRDGYERAGFDLKVISGVECLTGDGGWELNASGQVETMGHEKAAQKRRALNRTFARHLHGEGVAISATAPEEKEGRTWSVLRFAYPNGDLHDLLIDSATGESVWQRNVEDGRASWTRLSDLRVVDGLRHAWVQETFNDHAAENQTITWISIATNVGLDDTLFARPDGGARLARLPRGVTVTEWLPIELYQERYVFLRGTVNGVATDIVLDSGTGMTVLDKSLAEAAGLSAEGAIAAQGTGGRTEAGLVGGVTITVGALEIGPLSAAVLDLSDVGRRLGRPLPAILGKELFHALGIDLDYPNARIRFHDPDALRAGAPGRRLELLPADDGHKNVMMTIEGGGPVVVGLDTGQGGELTLFRHYATARGLLDGRPLSERLGAGVGGATTMKDCLWLEPGPDFAAPFPKEKTGLGLQWAASALTVEFVAPGSPAAADGWQTGVRVTALDGAPITPDWWRTTARWSRAPSGTRVTLTLADGAVRSLTLKEYY